MNQKNTSINSNPFKVGDVVRFIGDTSPKAARIIQDVSGDSCLIPPMTSFASWHHWTHLEKVPTAPAPSTLKRLLDALAVWRDAEKARRHALVTNSGGYLQADAKVQNRLGKVRHLADKAIAEGVPNPEWKTATHGLLTPDFTKLDVGPVPPKFDVAAIAQSMFTERLQDKIEAVEKAYFRTEHDTGANESAMFVWNLVRKWANLPPLKKSDLPAWCPDCAGYHKEGLHAHSLPPIKTLSESWAPLKEAPSFIPQSINADSCKPYWKDVMTAIGETKRFYDSNGSRIGTVESSTRREYTIYYASLNGVYGMSHRFKVPTMQQGMLVVEHLYEQFRAGQLTLD
jgi:hypothetical protein